MIELGKKNVPSYRGCVWLTLGSILYTKLIIYILNWIETSLGANSNVSRIYDRIGAIYLLYLADDSFMQMYWTTLISRVNGWLVISRRIFISCRLLESRHNSLHFWSFGDFEHIFTFTATIEGSYTIWWDSLAIFICSSIRVNCFAFISHSLALLYLSTAGTQYVVNSRLNRNGSENCILNSVQLLSRFVALAQSV